MRGPAKAHQGRVGIVRCLEGLRKSPEQIDGIKKPGLRHFCRPKKDVKNDQWELKQCWFGVYGASFLILHSLLLESLWATQQLLYCNSDRLVALMGSVGCCPKNTLHHREHKIQPQRHSTPAPASSASSGVHSSMLGPSSTAVVLLLDAEHFFFVFFVDARPARPRKSCRNGFAYQHARIYKSLCVCFVCWRAGAETLTYWRVRAEIFLCCCFASWSRPGKSGHNGFAYMRAWLCECSWYSVA